MKCNLNYRKEKINFNFVPHPQMPYSEAAKLENILQNYKRITNEYYAELDRAVNKLYENQAVLTKLCKSKIPKIENLQNKLNGVIKMIRSLAASLSRNLELMKEVNTKVNTALNGSPLSAVKQDVSFIDVQEAALIEINFYVSTETVTNINNACYEILLFTLRTGGLFEDQRAKFSLRKVYMYLNTAFLSSDDLKKAFDRLDIDLNNFVTGKFSEGDEESASKPADPATPQQKIQNKMQSLMNDLE